VLPEERAVEARAVEELAVEERVVEERVGAAAAERTGAAEARACAAEERTCAAEERAAAGRGARGVVGAAWALGKLKPTAAVSPAAIAPNVTTRLMAPLVPATTPAHRKD